jgi:Tol biopolymer transport system component
VSNGSVRRLTDYTFDSSRPALSGNGRYVAFSTDGDPTGGNADGSTEVFLVKVNKATLHLTQVTSGATGTSNNRAVLNNTGKRTFFQSNADLTGAGAESITSSSS